MNTPHKHAEIIKAWAEGAIIEYSNGGNEWFPTSQPMWSYGTFYRIKPERVFPSSILSQLSLTEIYTRGIQSHLGHARTLCKVADAAVKQYILLEEAQKAIDFQRFMKEESK